jgi:fucose permease
MAKTSRLLFFILFGAMILFGFIENIKGVTYPLIKTDYDATYEQQGLMVSLLSIAYVVFCFVGGIILGRWGVKKAFATGFMLMILGLAAAFFMPNFWTTTAALIIVFSAFGLFEVSVNALATQLFTVKAALLMSLLHFFYGVGSSLSPRAVGTIAGILSWREVYLFSIFLVLIVFIPSLFTRFPRQEGIESQSETGDSSSSEKGGERLSFFRTLKIPMVWVFSVVLGLMVAVELCSANWGGLYFQDVYQMDPKTSGAAFVSNFYILFTVSRLLSGFVIEKIGYVRALFIAALASVFIFTLGFFLGERGIYVLPGIGFFSAIFWPTLMATAMSYFKEDSPVATSAIIVIGGALNSGFQFLMGLTNRVIGPAWGYRSGLLYAVLVAVSLAVLSRCMRKPYY